MPSMTSTSLVAAEVLRTGKIIKNDLQNGTLHFLLKLVRVYADEKPTFLKWANSRYFLSFLST